MEKQRTWTQVGMPYIGQTLEGGKLSTRSGIEAAINRLEWRSVEGGIRVAFMPGDGIKNTIRQLCLPRVSEIAISHALAPYGFYGIRCHYKNGQVEIYVLDLGTEIVPLLGDFTPA